MCVLYEMLKGVPPWEQYHHSDLDPIVLVYQVNAIASCVATRIRKEPSFQASPR